MKIGLIDVDGHNFPNLPLMKLSAWHKAQGDSVEWYNPMLSGHMDKVYMSKVFTFSDEYLYPIDADVIECGGTGWATQMVEGREKYIKDLDRTLPYEIEHIYPDYSLYPELTEDKAYGFLSRGCPRNCEFCCVSDKDGKCSHKVADLNEFWNGQKHIVLLDGNTLACKDWRDLLQQLIDSKAKVEFNQGLDIRMMTEEKAEMLSRIKLEKVHFAYDRIEDKPIIEPRFKQFVKYLKIRPKDISVYVLCGDRERDVLPTDLERIYFLRSLGLSPYVMLYDKENIPKGHPLRKLQRWCNNRFVFWKVPTFEEYLNSFNKEKESK